MASSTFFAEGKIDKGFHPYFSPIYVSRSEIFIRCPLFPFFFRTKQNRKKESKKKVWLLEVSIGILYMAVGNVGELGKGTEREGFEPPVNKSLHSSSNATP